jgi:hypothetical protein
MREIAAKESRPGLARDAGNIENSPALVVIGVESNPAGLNCGFCGKPTCEALELAGGICAFNSIDLGIATACRRRKWPAGSTLTTASCIPSAGRAWIWECSGRRSNRRSAFP